MTTENIVIHRQAIHTIDEYGEIVPLSHMLNNSQGFELILDVTKLGHWGYHNILWIILIGDMGKDGKHVFSNGIGLRRFMIDKFGGEGWHISKISLIS